MDAQPNLATKRPQSYIETTQNDPKITPMTLKNTIF